LRAAPSRPSRWCTYARWPASLAASTPSRYGSAADRGVTLARVCPRAALRAPGGVGDPRGRTEPAHGGGAVAAHPCGATQGEAGVEAQLRGQGSVSEDLPGGPVGGPPGGGGEG